MKVPPSLSFAHKVVAIIIAGSALLLLILLIVFRSLSVLNSFGVSLFALWGILCIFVGYLDHRQADQQGQGTSWYNEATVRLGFGFLALAFIILFSHLVLLR